MCNNIQLSPHIKLLEFTKSATARRLAAALTLNRAAATRKGNRVA